MNGLFILIGALIIIGAIAFKIWPATRAYVKTKLLIAAIIGGIVLIGLSGAFFYVEAGYSYMVQFPTGHQDAVFKPGWNVKLWGDTIRFPNVITVRRTQEKDKNSDTQSDENTAIPVRFMDTVQAKASTSVRYRITRDEKKFIAMAQEFRSVENLIASTLEPHTMEAVKNAARELTAQEYVSGAASTFEMNFQDQVENGIVLLVKDKKKEQVEEEIVDANGQRTTKQNQIIAEKVIRVFDKAGQAKRKFNPLTQYGITIAQAICEDVQPHPDFRKRLKQQMDEAAKANIEKQKALRAEQETLKVIAEGERTKAEMKVKMEQEQVQVLTTAETAKKKEELARQQAEIALARAEIEAKNVTVRAKADADARRLKMQADGALELKLNAWVKAQEYWAAAGGKHQLVPTTVVGASGGQTNSANRFIDVLMANQAKQLGVSVQP